MDCKRFTFELSTGINMMAEQFEPPSGEGSAISDSLAANPKQPSTATFDGDLTSSYLNYSEFSRDNSENIQPIAPHTHVGLWIGGRKNYPS
jgi:hypothetical protein